MPGDINNPVPGLYMHKRKATYAELAADTTFLDGQIGFVFPDQAYAKLLGVIVPVGANPANLVFKDGVNAPFNGNIGIAKSDASFVTSLETTTDSLQIGENGWLSNDFGNLQTSMRHNAYRGITGALAKKTLGLGSSSIEAVDGLVDFRVCPSTEDDLTTGLVTMIAMDHKTVTMIGDTDSHIAESTAAEGDIFRNSLFDGKLSIKGADDTSTKLGNYMADISMFGASPAAAAAANVSAIQRAIDLCESSSDYECVYIPKGVYNINSYLEIGDNVKMIGANGAELRASLAQNLMITNKTGGSGYTGNENIRIENIIFDCNRTTTGQDVTAIGFAHCTKIRIVGCDFTAWSEWHGIELNACADSSVIDCQFYDAIKADLNEEAVQLDIANNFGAFPWPSGEPYDGTPCKNIVVHNCTFHNISTGVGCHNSQANTTVDDVKITGCTFSEVEYRCVSGYNWNRLIVMGCTATDTERFVNCYHVNLTTAKKITGINVSNNILKDIRYGLNVDNDGGITTDRVVDGVTFSNNIMHDVSKVAGSSRGLWIQGSLDSKIYNIVANGNILEGGAQYGITADYGAEVKFSNNYVTGCQQSGIVQYRCFSGSMVGNTSKGNNLTAGSYYDIDFYSAGATLGLLQGNQVTSMNVDGALKVSILANFIDAILSVNNSTTVKITGNDVGTSINVVGGSDVSSNANYISGTWTI